LLSDALRQSVSQPASPSTHFAVKKNKGSSEEMQDTKKDISNRSLQPNKRTRHEAGRTDVTELPFKGPFSSSSSMLLGCQSGRLLSSRACFFGSNILSFFLSFSLSLWFFPSHPHCFSSLMRDDLSSGWF